MKIALVNTWDVSGGAARAAYRLFQGLHQRGHSVSYLVHDKKQEHPDIVGLSGIDSKDRFLELLVQRKYIDDNRTNLSNTTFTFSYAGVSVSECDGFANADIVNLHWVEKFISLKNFVNIFKSGKPLVWTLHDERPFTGGCHYSAGCTNYERECFPCPQLEKDPFALPRTLLLAAEEVVRDANVTVVTPSKWLGDMARKSRLFRNKRVEVIPNSVETDIYKPFSKIKAKRELGLEPESIALMFGAENHVEKRKGFAHLMEAMRICLNDELFLKSCGDGKVIILTVGAVVDTGQYPDIPVRHFGYVRDDAKMVSIYNAADIFILPSLEDNLPNTMLEAMACMTPVIGFRTGGIPDFVNDEESGLLAEIGNANGLAKAILRMIFDKDLREKCGRKSRELIEESCKIEHQATVYSKLFSELVGNNIQEYDYIKGHTENSITKYDSLFGAALRFCLEKEVKTPLSEIECPICASDSRYVDYINLKRSLDKLCQVRAVTNPVKKYQAYRKVLFAYRKIR